jgi:hypothetical protein
MQLCDRFRVLVDKAIERTPALNVQAIEDGYADRFAHIQPAQRYTVLCSLVGEGLRSRTGTGVSFQEFRQMRKAIRFQSAIGLAPEPYVEIAHFIQDSCRYDFSRSLYEEDAWLNAIDAARSYSVLYGALPDLDLRAAAVTEAASRLIADGYSVCIENDRLHLDRAELERLCADLQADIRTLGGGIVLSQLFALLRASGQFDQERFIPGRVFQGNKPRPPSLPFGYLVNLGVKHLNSAPIRDAEAAARIWKRVAEHSRDLVALYDVEPYHHIENIVLAPRNVPAYLSSLALFDHVFTLRQWRPSETVELLRGLLDFVDPVEVEHLLGWALDDAWRLAEVVLGRGTEQDMNAYSDDQIIAGGIEESRWRIMRQDFVHAFGVANRDYAKPVDADKSDFGFKPLIEVHRKYLVSISPSVSALGFFEAITCALRERGYPALDEKLGRAIERFTAGALRAHGLTVSVEGEKYKMFDPLKGANQAGECDLVAEGSDFIAFVETKKKPQRRCLPLAMP